MSAAQDWVPAFGGRVTMKIVVPVLTELIKLEQNQSQPLIQWFKVWKKKRQKRSETHFPFSVTQITRSKREFFNQ